MLCFLILLQDMAKKVFLTTGQLTLWKDVSIIEWKIGLICPNFIHRGVEIKRLEGIQGGNYYGTNETSGVLAPDFGHGHRHAAHVRTPRGRSGDRARRCNLLQ